MTSIRSSVRPASSKQPWGTILVPEFGLGHQRMTAYEIEQVVERLTRVPHKTQGVELLEDRRVPATQVHQMVERLSRAECVPDSDRRGARSSDMGLLNSYAWKGYN